MSDNRMFNVNGRTDEMLEATLRLALGEWPVRSYKISDKSGMLLGSGDGEGWVKFPVPLDAKQVFPIVKAYLDSEPQVEFEQWERNADHDGHNEMGWRVYCEDWGHVEAVDCTAVKPCWLWYGK